MLGASWTCSLVTATCSSSGPTLTERHESQVASDQALLDGRELRRVGFDVDVDVLELADLLAVAVEQQLPVPFCDVPLALLLWLVHLLCLLALSCRLLGGVLFDICAQLL
jgi:hypothetical protein